MEKILNYKIFQLNDAAAEFLQNRLNIHTSLSTSIKREVNFDIGKMFTFFPEYVEEANLNDFKSGGILEIDSSKIKISDGMRIEEIPDTSDGLSEYIYNYLIKNENNVVIVENILAKPYYEYVEKFPSKKIIVKENVYYLLSNDATKESILNVIKHCSSMPEMIGIFSKISDIKLYSNKDILGESFLVDAVNNIEGLFVEAYDHEGYIIWEKSK